MPMLRQIFCWLCLLPVADMGLSMPSIAVTSQHRTSELMFTMSVAMAGHAVQLVDCPLC